MAKECAKLKELAKNDSWENGHILAKLPFLPCVIDTRNKWAGNWGVAESESQGRWVEGESSGKLEDHGHELKSWISFLSHFLSSFSFLFNFLAWILVFSLSSALFHSFLFFSLFLSKNTLGCSYHFTNFPVSFHCPFPPSSYLYLLFFLSTIIPQICCCTAIPESAQVRSNVYWLHLTLEIFKTDGFNRLLTIANCLNCFNCGRFFIPLQTPSPGPQPPCQAPREVSLSPAPLSITSAPWPCRPWGAHADPPGAHGSQQPAFPAPSPGSLPLVELGSGCLQSCLRRTSQALLLQVSLSLFSFTPVSWMTTHILLILTQCCLHFTFQMIFF